ncbi:MAG TPA: hypothetical protein DDY39_05500 [Nitrospira sp.]|nr:hypothetical protein [Nitrospira sp.]HBR49897.1 hypothetical protein [Nitrospira sp.]
MVQLQTAAQPNQFLTLHQQEECNRHLIRLAPWMSAHCSEGVDFESCLLSASASKHQSLSEWFRSWGNDAFKAIAIQAESFQ